MLAQIVATVARRVGFIAIEGVAVSDHPGGRVVTGDGQGVAQLRGDRLRKTDRHATVDQVDAADTQAAQTIGGRYRETAALGQCPRIGRRAVRQIGFVEGQLATGRPKPGEGHRIIDWRRWNNRRDRVVTIVDDRVTPLFGKLGNAVEPGGGETDDRVDPPTDFRQQDKTVPATQLTGGVAGGVGTGGGGFSGLGRVVTGGDGFLDLLDIGQLRITRGHGLRSVHMRRLAGQQLAGHGQAAVAAQGQFLAILQMNGDGAFGPGDQLIAGKQLVALDQGAASAVDALGENLTNDFSDGTDERCHVKSSAADHRRHWFAKQPMAQSGYRGDARTSTVRLAGGTPSGNISAIKHFRALFKATRLLTLRNGDETLE